MSDTSNSTSYSQYSYVDPESTHLIERLTFLAEKDPRNYGDRLKVLEEFIRTADRVCRLSYAAEIEDLENLLILLAKFHRSYLVLKSTYSIIVYYIKKICEQAFHIWYDRRKIGLPDNLKMVFDFDEFSEEREYESIETDDGHGFFYHSRAPWIFDELNYFHEIEKEILFCIQSEELKKDLIDKVKDIRPLAEIFDNLNDYSFPPAQGSEYAEEYDKLINALPDDVI